MVRWYQRKSSRPRRYKRSRMMKRRYRRTRRVAAYDGMMAVKCHHVVAATHLPAGYNTAIIQWGSQDVVANVVNVRITDSQEFTAIRAQFKHYKIQGVKVEFRPAMLNIQTQNTTMYSLYKANFTDEFPTQATNLSSFERKPDYKIKSAGRPLKAYVNCRKYHKSRGLDWLDTDIGVYPQACTALRWETGGFADNQGIGTIHCTWYVKFKGPTV